MVKAPVAQGDCHISPVRPFITGLGQLDLRPVAGHVHLGSIRLPGLVDLGGIGQAVGVLAICVIRWVSRAGEVLGVGPLCKSAISTPNLTGQVVIVDGGDRVDLGRVGELKGLSTGRGARWSKVSSFVPGHRGG